MKVGKSFPPAEELCRKAQELEQIIESKRNQVPLNPESTRKLPKLPNISPQAIKHLWIRTALIEKVLDKIVLYLVENSSKFYEKEAVLMDPVDGPILASLLVGPCALEYTKMKTADHFWTDPSADELVQRHRIHSAHCRQDSPTKRPALCIQKRHSSSSMDERPSPSPSARDYVESLHQNSRATLLFGKNNVLVQPRDDMEAIPGYLSLHQTADIMTLKWTPNQLMNGSVGDLDYERSVYWDYAMTIRLEEIVYLHCHQQGWDPATPAAFPKGGSPPAVPVLSGERAPPPWSTGPAPLVPERKVTLAHPTPPSSGARPLSRSLSLHLRRHPPQRSRTLVVPKRSCSTPDLMDQGATMWHPTPRKSSCSSCSQRLAYCRHLSTVRTHLSALVNHAIVDPDVPHNAYGGLTVEVWQRFMEDCSSYEEQELLRLVYFGGVDPSLRKEVWPFLLGHYQFGMSEAERKEVDEQVRACYEQTMSEWLGCEAIVRQREKEQHAAALAKCSSGASMDSTIQRMMHRDSTVSNELFSSAHLFSTPWSSLLSSGFLFQVFESVEEVDQIETEPKSSDEAKQVPKIPNGTVPNGTTSPDSGHPSSRNFSITSGLSDRSLSTEDSGAPEASAKNVAVPQQQPPAQPGPVKAEQAAGASPSSSPTQGTKSQPQANGKEPQAKDVLEKGSKSPVAKESLDMETKEVQSAVLEEAKGLETEDKREAETEVAISPGTEVVKSATTEEVKSPEVEKLKSPQAEEAKSPEKERVKSPEMEVIKSPEIEKVKSPLAEAKSPVTEKVKSPEAEEEKSPEIEAIKSPENEEDKSHEIEAIKSPQKEVAKSPETPVDKSPENERVESPEADEAKSPEIEVIKSPESEVIKSLETEMVKSPESEIIKSLETEVVKSPESEAAKSPETEMVKSPESEAAKSPEIEIVKSLESEVIKSLETEVVKSPESEAAKSPEIEMVKSPESEVIKSLETEMVKSPESEVIKSSETEIVKSPEADETKSPETNRLKSPKAETKSPEIEVAKSPEAEKVKLPEPEEAKSPETEKVKSPETEVAKSPEIEKVKLPEAEARSPEKVKSPGKEVFESPLTEEAKSPENVKALDEESKVKSPEIKEAKPLRREVNKTPATEIVTSTEMQETRIPETETVKSPEKEEAKGIEEEMKFPKLDENEVTELTKAPETEEPKPVEVKEAEVKEIKSPVKASVSETGETGQVMATETEKDKAPDREEVRAPDADTFKACDPEDTQGTSIASSTIDTSEALLTIESDESPSAIEMEEIPMAKGSVISWDRKGPLALASPPASGPPMGEAVAVAGGLPVLELRLEDEGEKPSPEGTESVLSEEPEMESLFPQFDSLAVAAEMKNEAASPVSSIGTTYSQELLDMYTINLHRIEKDVQRCDRNYWYFTPANLEKLRNIMCSYIWQHLDIGYVQGMCDLLAPLLVILDDELVYDDVFAVWETIWAAKYTSSGHFVLFIALALVELYRDIILENNMDFTDIIKFFNEMAEHHNIKQVLTLARDLVCKVQTLIENKLPSVLSVPAVSNQRPHTPVLASILGLGIVAKVSYGATQESRGQCCQPKQRATIPYDPVPNTLAVQRDTSQKLLCTGSFSKQSCRELDAGRVSAYCDDYGLSSEEKEKEPTLAEGV
ncbi:hypothetical protein JZ751_023466, partial [Albula glossodonta]